MNKRIATGFLTAVALTASMAGTAFAAEGTKEMKMIPLATAATEAVELVAAVEITEGDFQEMPLVKLVAEGEDTMLAEVLSVDWIETIKVEGVPFLQAMKLIPLESAESEK